jgi:predicted metal-dependent peptidase
MQKPIETRITAARTRLLLDFPWFGSLAMRLKIDQSSEIKTFATDGTRLLYNPATAATYTDAELVGVLAHETMHCALLHPYRRANRDPKLWNVATDYAINSELIRSGLKLPANVLIDAQFDGLSADVIYARLAKQSPQQPQPQGNPSGTPGTEPDTGEIQDAPPEPAPSSPQPADADQPAPAQPQQMTATDWQIAAEQATDVARGFGKLPGGIDRAVKQSRTEPVDWRAILREFIEHTAPSDYSWTSPNRRHIANGLYLPGIVKENIGPLAVAVDTSGSIDGALLAAFAKELNAIASEAKPEFITVLYCDASVQSSETFSPDDEIVMHPAGGGGTRFAPVFDAISKWEQPPVALIYFTDLDCSDRPTEPEFPVLWATDLAVTADGPFGQTVRLTI